jgi:hypothetical protein
VFNLQRLYNWRLERIWGIFRSSGRFIWPLYYVILAFALATVLRYLSRRAATTLLVAAVLIQAVDIQALGGIATNRPPPTLLENPAWDLARGAYRHLVLYPPQIRGVEKQCGTVYTYARQDEYVPFAYKAYLLGLTINSGYVARPKTDALARHCAELRAQVAEGVFASDTIYVFRDDESSRLRLDKLVCGRLDGYDVCVVAQYSTALSTHLRHRNSNGHRR